MGKTQKVNPQVEKDGKTILAEVQSRSMYPLITPGSKVPVIKDPRYY